MNHVHSSFTVLLTSLIFGTALTMTDVLFIKTGITDLMKAFISSSLLFGALIGTILAPLLSNSLKNTIIIANMFYFVGTLLLNVKDAPGILVIGRIFIGSGAGIVCTIVPIYLSMLAPEKHKNIVVSLHQLGIVTGLLIGQVMSYMAEFGINRHILFSYTVFVGVVCIISLALKS